MNQIYLAKRCRTNYCSNLDFAIKLLKMNGYNKDGRKPFTLL